MKQFLIVAGVFLSVVLICLALFSLAKPSSVKAVKEVVSQPAVQEAVVKPKEEPAALCTNPKFKMADVVTTVIGNYRGQVWKVFPYLDKDTGTCLYGVTHEIEGGGTSQDFQYWEFEITK